MSSLSALQSERCRRRKRLRGRSLAKCWMRRTEKGRYSEWPSVGSACPTKRVFEVVRGPSGIPG